MRFRDVLSISSGNLRRTRGRTLLSVLGIVVGIMSVILVLSIGEAARGYIINQISSFGSDLVFVESGPPSELEEGGIPSPFPKEVLTEKDYKRLVRQSWMKSITAVTMQQDTFEANGQSMNGQTYGTTEDEMTLYDVRIAQGQFFAKEDVDAANRVVVLGWNVSTNLFGADDAVGKTIKVNDRSFRVVGVMAKSGSRFLQDLDTQVYIPYSAALDLYGLKYLTMIVMKTHLPLTEGVANIRETIREQHDIINPTDDDFRVLTQEDAVKSTEQITGILQIFLTSVAGISLLVGGIGIMNIMYVTVTERTREIGLRKAIGAKRNDILGQFVVESILLTAFGGVLGVILGTGLTWLAIFIIQQFQDGWNFSISVAGIILGVGGSSIIGLVFGYAPASRAAKMNPIEALRHE